MRKGRMLALKEVLDSFLSWMERRVLITLFSEKLRSGI
jgi:hypothetical protein